jgi:hypothetical protein
MPFTFSHPAIILPLINKRKKIFSSTGLIIGCIIPDFESFIRFTQHKIYSHSWMGIFWYDLPMAVIFAFIFHDIIRDPLIKNLPEFFKNKFTKYTGFNWNQFFKKHFFMIIISMIAGIFSHLLWDAFTHLNLVNPNAIDSNVYVGSFRLYKALQYSNSLIGMLVVIFYIMRLPDDAPVKKTVKPEKMIFFIEKPQEIRYEKLQYWILVLSFIIVTTVIAIASIPDYIDIILLIDIIISGTLIGIILTPGIQKIIKSIIH